MRKALLKYLPNKPSEPNKKWAEYQAKQLQTLELFFLHDEKACEVKSAVNELIFDDLNFQAFRYLKVIEKYATYGYCRDTMVYNISECLSVILALSAKLEKTTQSQVLSKMVMNLAELQRKFEELKLFSLSDLSNLREFLNSYLIFLARHPDIDLFPKELPSHESALASFIEHSFGELSEEARKSLEASYDSPAILVTKIQESYLKGEEIGFLTKIGFFNNLTFLGAMSKLNPMKEITLVFDAKNARLIESSYDDQDEESQAKAKTKTKRPDTFILRLDTLYQKKAAEKVPGNTTETAAAVAASVSTTGSADDRDVAMSDKVEPARKFS